jgi:hypothetical protein
MIEFFFSSFLSRKRENVLDTQNFFLIVLHLFVTFDNETTQ